MEAIKTGVKKDLELARYCYEHIVPKHVIPRVARQIAGRDDLRNLDKSQRMELEKHVAAFIKEFGYDELAIFSTTYELDQKKGRIDL